MPSYKKHLLFSILISLILVAPFFPNVFYLALSVVGASIVDLDHPVRNRNLLLLALSGLVLVTVLYIFKMPLVLGLTLILIALIFFVSSHRGFMHSIVGVIIIATLLALFTYTAFLMLVGFSVAVVPSLAIISVLLGLIILNKQIVPFYVVGALLGIFLISSPYFNPYYVLFAFLIGSMSHIALDMFTGSGVKLFSPLSEKKFGKKTVFILALVWVIGIIWFYW
ncbi:MAG TPA: metal-dependent hydrolase [Methanobacteriaceae archaeon]|nr:metal-dependent hydrolase [Methanobacteriaceae archaeon]